MRCRWPGGTCRREFYGVGDHVLLEHLLARDFTRIHTAASRRRSGEGGNDWRDPFGSLGLSE